jgi:hypothetical protein
MLTLRYFKYEFTVVRDSIVPPIHSTTKSKCAVYERWLQRIFHEGRCQKSVNKMDTDHEEFCDDKDLEPDDHNHKGLAQYAIDNANLAYENKDKLTKTEQTVISQIGYNCLLENEHLVI